MSSPIAAAKKLCMHDQINLERLAQLILYEEEHFVETKVPAQGDYDDDNDGQEFQDDIDEDFLDLDKELLENQEGGVMMLPPLNKGNDCYLNFDSEIGEGKKDGAIKLIEESKDINDTT